MPKIDFYILATDNENHRLEFVCRLIEKAYKNQRRIYVHAKDRDAAHQLDELLWTYRDECFLPHHLYGEGPNPLPPIQIGFDIKPDQHRDILINLHSTIPDFFTQFSRVCEVISNDPDCQAAARDNYRAYRAQGHDITTHKLQSIEA
jgi:DNA polymerase III subunit chi